MDHFNSIIGQSPELDSLIRSAKIAASTDVTILIKGETGTGKEVLASAIQKSSRRADKKFITLNCAALPEGLIESELFGHKKAHLRVLIATPKDYLKPPMVALYFLMKSTLCRFQFKENYCAS